MYSMDDAYTDTRTTLVKNIGTWEVQKQNAKRDNLNVRVPSVYQTPLFTA